MSVNKNGVVENDYARRKRHQHQQRNPERFESLDSGARALIEPPRLVGRGSAIVGLLGGSRCNQRTTAGRRENSDESRSAMISSPASRR
ncbi:hypothetical protein H8B02_18130 [Bradyrhizobium sp. Pear77]|uniref:hypothetical protein n=1 Tax=Bradyrhizobium altum TaxID=1571202 RepID=UPI001E31A556|nr:hypothetical protein [Bradyrhizobium altum]MCC8955286.1 hypothetical protein [Bradyrhizobium altum]